MKNLMDTAIEYLCDIASLGYEAFIVGGAVRDSLLGKDVSDIDIATDCPIEILEKNFNTHDIGRSKDFGILVVLYKGYSFETAQLRTETSYSDGRRPDKVELVGDIYQDLARRDFTINAMAMSLYRVIIDPYNGQRDLERKLIRAVGDPMVRFSEDYLRMMRAARFGAMEGFSIERDTRLAIRRLAPLVNKVVSERIRMELIKAADISKPGTEFARFILTLDRLKLLSKILPEVHALKYLNHDLRWHPEGLSVFNHVIRALELMEFKPWESKLATLFHDIGKSYYFDDSKYTWKLTYHKHEKGSAEMTRSICERLKFSSYHTEQLVFAVANHMKFHILLDMKPSKISRIISSPYFETLVDVCYADEFARGETFQRPGKFWAALNRANEIKTQWEKRIAGPAKLVSGKTIMNILGIRPGPTVGRVKRIVEDAIIDQNVDLNNQKTIYNLILRSFLIKEEEN